MKTVVASAEFFSKNRERLSHALKPGSVAIFHSNDEMYRTSDQNFPFRQDSDLFYLCGIVQEKTILLIAPDHPDESLREVLFIRKTTKKLEIWEGHKLSSEEAQLISGIKNVKTNDEYTTVLATLMAFAHHIYLNVSEFPKFIPDLPNRNLRYANELKQIYPAHQYERLAPILRDLRVTKSETEIAFIREACRITQLAFQKVLEVVNPGMTEYEIEAEITREFIRNGALGHAYPPIIASGINACSLHYTYNNQMCNDGDLLLMDFGAEYGYYAADCSRTIPVNGKFTQRQKDLYQSVLDVFKYALTIIKPGNTINGVHNEVCHRFGLEHVRLGLYTSEELENQDKNHPLYRQYYMHGTSHFLGLDVHDVGNKECEFRPGMIVTCEPGIYIPAEKTGIRLENDILITREGNVDLMKDIPIEIEELENLLKR